MFRINNKRNELSTHSHTGLKMVVSRFEHCLWRNYSQVYFKFCSDEKCPYRVNSLRASCLILCCFLLCQGLANCSSWTKLFQQIKFNWDTDKPVHLHTTDACFRAATAELSHCHRNIMTHKVQSVC